MPDRSKNFVLWFNEIGIDDVPMVGGKCASLGEMYGKLHDKGINIPNGFAITAYAYRYFLKYAGIEDEVVIIGVNNCLELWNKEQWGAEKAESKEQAWIIIESLDKQ